MFAWALFLWLRVKFVPGVLRIWTRRGTGRQRGLMTTLAGGEDEVRERVRLERSIYDACKRSPEGSDFLVSAFVQALHSYRRSSGMYILSISWRASGLVCEVWLRNITYMVSVHGEL